MIKKYALIVSSLLVLLLVFVSIFNPFNLKRFSKNLKASTWDAVTLPVYPQNYWEFSGSTTTAQKTATIVGTSQNTDFGGTQTPTWTVGTGGPTGNFIKLTGNGNTAASLSSSTGWAIEFMFRPDRTFETGTIFSFGSNFKLELHTPVGGNVHINTSQARFRITRSGTVHDIILDKVGRRSLSYISDGNFHHFVVQYDPGSSTQKIQMWIDGQLAEGYVINQTVSTSGNVNFSGMSSAEYNKCNCDLDSIALYTKPLPPNLIVQHYKDMLAGVPYSSDAPIPYDNTTDSVAGALDPLDYMAGSNISNTTTHTLGVNTTVIDQLKSYPLPRYKPGNTLIRNFPNWMFPAQLGNTQSSVNSSWFTGSTTTSGNKAKAINDQMARKWNYMIAVELPSTIHTIMNEVANDSSLINVPTSIQIHRNQLHIPVCGNANYACIRYQGFPPSHYLQNSLGQFLYLQQNLTLSTAVTSSYGGKLWRPVTTHESDYMPDGLEMKSRLQNLVNTSNFNLRRNTPATSTKVIDYINENGEIFPVYWPGNGPVNAVNLDSVVQAAYTIAKNNDAVLGLPVLNEHKYLARVMTSNERNTYANIIKTATGLQNSTFTEYALSGNDATGPANYTPDWRESRSINDTINGIYYATPDFYVRYPHNWRYWSGAWHGWQWFVNAINTQIDAGDPFYSPYVSAGWANNETQTVRPAQWLGLLKVLNMTGAEFMYPGYFGHESSWPYPENYVWQVTTPAYAQGVLSHYETIFKNGKLMRGDMNRWVYPPDTAPGFRFSTGNLGHIVVARKQDNALRYAITGMENPWSNLRGQVPEESVADIMFGGQTHPLSVNTLTENLKFKVRRQGSTYIYDKTGTGAPVFYQLDAWHESSHPWWWSKDFNFEAEVYDTNTGIVNRTTTTPAGTPAGDYTNFTTYITSASGTSTYNFEPRDASGNSNKTYHLWVLAKSATGTSSGQFKVNSLTAQTISTNSTSFTWCKAPSTYTIPANTQHTLTFTGTSANFQVDKMLLTTDGSLNLGNCGTETIPPVVSITSPTNGHLAQGGVNLNITADATDNSGIASVEFFIDGVSINVDQNQPYTALWDTTGVTGGPYVITALATDLFNNQTTSDPVTVYVLSGTYVYITDPANNSIVYDGDTYVMRSVAGGPITKVRYFRKNMSNNVIGKCTSTIPPSFSCNWTPNGGILNLVIDFEIHALGYDSVGNIIATSPTITVTRMENPNSQRNSGNIFSRNRSSGSRESSPPPADSGGIESGSENAIEEDKNTVDQIESGSENAIEEDKNAVDQIKPDSKDTEEKLQDDEVLKTEEGVESSGGLQVETSL